MWVAFLPVALVPSWQLTQLLTMPVWSNLAGSQAVVEWQLSHSEFVGTWLAFLPVAFTPSWQDEQLPRTFA